MININKIEDKRGEFVRPKFLSFTLGMHRVRILGDLHPKFIHFLRGVATITCLGSECPICQRNKVIKLENPDNFNKVPGYLPSQLRYYFNGLDRTPAKICPKCGYENKANMENIYVSACEECGTMIQNIEPETLNVVKVVTVSQTNMGKLEVMQKTVLDDDEEPIGLDHFDVIFNSAIVGKKKEIWPVADENSVGPVEYDEDTLYDLDNIVPKLTAEEIVSLLSGVALRDIFASRGTADEVELDAEDVSEVEGKVEELFKN